LNPRQIAVIIPSGNSERDASLAGLLEDLRNQTIPPVETQIVRGVSPNGKARNQGVEKTSAETLVFLDDDVRLDQPDVLEKLAKALDDSSLGLVGTSQLLPPDSSPFQRRCAEQIPRSRSAVVGVLTDSDMVTTQCCAIRRSVLDQIGGFNDKILRGVDPELRHRVRQAGLRVAVVPGAWHYHPMPQNLAALWRMAWRNGFASAFAQRHFPDTVLFNPEGHVAEFDARPSLARRFLRRATELLGRLARGAHYGVVYDLAYALGYLSSLTTPSSSINR
jgi:glycosyltransferase involved in cell wall biosynthesis